MEASVYYGDTVEKEKASLYCGMVILSKLCYRSRVLCFLKMIFY